MQTLGQSIIGMRVRQRLKQKDLAKTAGLSQRYLSTIENDHVDPRFSVVQRIAAALQVSVGDLVRDVCVGRAAPAPLAPQPGAH